MVLFKPPAVLFVATYLVSSKPTSAPAVVLVIVNVLLPVLNLPLVKVKVLLSVISLLIVNPAALLSATASLAPNVNVPVLVILCAAVPLNVNVFAEAGSKVNVCPAATEIFPFILIPPVRFQFPD
jgi:hypothetical protein